MPTQESRKESIRKFKEQKTRLGAYAVRSSATADVWVGVSRNLDATKNGCWFTLRNGMHQEKSLQAEWNAHGESAFSYEILDVLAEDAHPLEIDTLLKNMKKDWLARLNAQPLL
ncbi:MAG: GIY-YIG nuclease family protein [Terracidiphilus sp.]|nr:GIY-YIG nuclease family protein [Terracidiphilus sp.]